MTATITITTTPEGYSIKMRGLTRETFALSIETLKRVVSPPHRRFEPESKAWIVSLEAQEQLAHWCGYMTAAPAASVQWIEAEQEHEPQPTSAPLPLDAYATLWLVPGCPRELVKVAYRELAKLNHPDVGGDTLMMQRINDAYRQLAA